MGPFRDNIEELRHYELTPLQWPPQLGRLDDGVEPVAPALAVCISGGVGGFVRVAMPAQIVGNDAEGDQLDDRGGLKIYDKKMEEQIDEFLIRKARPDEAPALAEAERVIAWTPGQLASRPEELNDADFEQRILTLNQGETGLFVVVEHNGTLVGHAILDPLKLAVTAHVVCLTIAIHEGYQGRGLGRQLMTHLISWTRAHPKIEKFELQVRSSNERAIALYKSLGFTEEGRKTRRLKYGPGSYVDDVYMALWVGP